MDQLDDLLKQDPDLWVGSLPKYQQEIVQVLLRDSGDPQEAATRWLSASGPANTFPFGSRKPEAIFYDKLIQEVESFLCGGQAYAGEREEFLKRFDARQAYVVGAISAAVAPVVGSAAAIVAPAIALSLMAVGKMGLRAWCGMRAELRASTDSAAEDLA